MILNPGNPRASDKTLATTIEAVIGAVKLDGGDAAVAALLTQLNLSHELLVGQDSPLNFLVHKVVSLANGCRTPRTIR